MNTSGTMAIVASCEFSLIIFGNYIVPKGFRSPQHTVKFIIVITYYPGTGFVPAPFSTNALNNNNIKEGGNNQKLILFNLGNQCI